MGHAAAAISYGEYMIVQVLRFVSLPLLHAIWSGIFGYFVGIAALSKASKRATVLIGIALVSVLHGVYDTFSEGWLGFFVAAFSLLLFVGYIRAQSGVARGVSNATVTT